MVRLAVLLIALAATAQAATIEPGRWVSHDEWLRRLSQHAKAVRMAENAGATEADVAAMNREIRQMIGQAATDSTAGLWLVIFLQPDESFNLRPEQVTFTVVCDDGETVIAPCVDLYLTQDERLQTFIRASARPRGVPIDASRDRWGQARYGGGIRLLAAVPDEYLGCKIAAVNVEANDETHSRTARVPAGAGGVKRTWPGER